MLFRSVAHKYRIQGHLRELLVGKNAKLNVEVDIYSGPKLAAIFSGTFVVIPSAVQDSEDD